MAFSMQDDLRNIIGLIIIAKALLNREMRLFGVHALSCYYNHYHLDCLKHFTAQKMKFSIKDLFLFSKFDQIHSFLWIWSHLLKRSLMENFIFCAVFVLETSCYTSRVLIEWFILKLRDLLI